MSKYGQLAKNTILIGVGSFSSKLLTFLCVPLYTALLTTEQYGLAGHHYYDIDSCVSVLTAQHKRRVDEVLSRGRLRQASHIQHEHLITFAGFAILALLAPLADNIGAISACYPLFMMYYIGYTLLHYNVLLRSWH